MNGAEWRWVEKDVVLAIHDEQLAEHGGMKGLRDESLLLSALARPQNLAAYGTPDVADLAASYAVGIARNHAFIDGNKRTALVVAAGVFLPLNGYKLTASDGETVRVMLTVADGSTAEQELALWFAHIPFQCQLNDAFPCACSAASIGDSSELPSLLRDRRERAIGERGRQQLQPSRETQTEIRPEVVDRERRADS